MDADALAPAPALAYPHQHQHQPQPQPRPELDAVQSAPRPPLPSVSPETAAFLRAFLPPPRTTPPAPQTRPFVTLTYAASLDSHLAIAPGQQTALSGPLTKSLTHYLRSKHDGILVGVGTATADDPGLNCRLAPVDPEARADGDGAPPPTLTEEGDLVAPTPDPLAGQPQPVIIDPNRRWHFTRDSRIFQAVREGTARAPIILTHAASRQGPGEAERWRILCEHGGMFMCPTEGGKAGGKKKKNVRWSWKYLLEFLYAEAGLKSIMIEGGAGVINDLLGSKENLELIDSVIITIAPVYLGKGGVNVSPPGPTIGGVKAPAAQFKDVEWTILGRDVVMAARPQLS